MTFFAPLVLPQPMNSISPNAVLFILGVVGLVIVYLVTPPDK